jgi:hypothetical protein
VEANSRTGSAEQILRVLRLVADLKHVHTIPADHERDLAGMEEALTDRFGEEAVLAGRSALPADVARSRMAARMPVYQRSG